MTAANLPKSLEQIFGSEGGFSDDPDDPGNWSGGAIGVGKLIGTKFGVAANSYPKLNIRALTLDQAAEIYRRDYAAKIRYDDLPSGLDHAMLDFAINSGPCRAVKFLQRVLSVPDDGAIGKVTLTEAKEANPVVTIKALCANRLAYLRGLRTWSKYRNGWSRRVNEVEAFALGLAQEGGPTRPQSQKPLPSIG